MQAPDPRQFYDDLAAEYHLLFADWQQAIQWQGQVIDGLIHMHWQGLTPARTILDCTCGIGTQALGLAGLGYRVMATDLSAESVNIAREQAQKMGLGLRFDVADIRRLSEAVAGTFEIVLAFDNALPHLPPSDLRHALAQIKQKVTPDGLFMASIRDYDALLIERPRSQSRRELEGLDGKRIVYQDWEWSEDGSQYIVNQHIIREVDGQPHASHYATTYYPLLREELTLMLHQAGFRDVKWLIPTVSGYYQPVVVAHHRVEKSKHHPHVVFIPPM